MKSRLRLDRSGASAAEFAMVLPLLILFLFGIIDGGRYLWEVNKAEKATQFGARMAVVTDPVPAGLADEDYVGINGLTQGDIIPAGELDPIVCTEAGGCNCSGACPADFTADPGAFNQIVDRMKLMKPDIDASNVTISYRGAGLGFAGDPNGMEIAPLVTVELDNVMFRPLVLFNAVAIELPVFRTTLTAEDSSGSQSN